MTTIAPPDTAKVVEPSADSIAWPICREGESPLSQLYSDSLRTMIQPGIADDPYGDCGDQLKAIQAQTGLPACESFENARRSATAAASMKIIGELAKKIGLRLLPGGLSNARPSKPPPLRSKPAPPTYDNREILDFVANHKVHPDLQGTLEAPGVNLWNFFHRINGYFVIEKHAFGRIEVAAFSPNGKEFLGWMRLKTPRANKPDRQAHRNATPTELKDALFEIQRNSPVKNP